MSPAGNQWDQLTLTFDGEDLRAICEVLLFVSGEPLTVRRIVEILGGFHTESEVRETILRLAGEYDNRGSGLQIIEVAGGFRFCTRPNFDYLVRRYHQEKKKLRLSIASLETLAIIAYRQPITTPEIEAIRGVNVTSNIRNLLDKHLIRIVGRKKAVGKPLIFGTTQEFLEYFGLKDLASLPAMDEFMQAFDEGPEPQE
jgi:segregation and condensation protein B